MLETSCAVAFLPRQGTLPRPRPSLPLLAYQLSTSSTSTSPSSPSFRNGAFQHGNTCTSRDVAYTNTSISANVIDVGTTINITNANLHNTNNTTPNCITNTSMEESEMRKKNENMLLEESFTKHQEQNDLDANDLPRGRSASMRLVSDLAATRVGGGGGGPTIARDERVDYLSYDFDAFELHECWRVATRTRCFVQNGRRLENASWRRFFQLKFGLKTVDPSTLNWEKDSDVCWLYGPLYAPLDVLRAEYATCDEFTDTIQPRTSPYRIKRLSHKLDTISVSPIALATNQNIITTATVAANINEGYVCNPITKNNNSSNDRNINLEATTTTHAWNNMSPATPRVVSSTNTFTKKDYSTSIKNTGTEKLKCGVESRDWCDMAADQDFPGGEGVCNSGLFGVRSTIKDCNADKNKNTDSMIVGEMVHTVSSTSSINSSSNMSNMSSSSKGKVDIGLMKKTGLWVVRGGSAPCSGSLLLSSTTKLEDLGGGDSSWGVAKAVCTLTDGDSDLDVEEEGSGLWSVGGNDDEKEEEDEEDEEDNNNKGGVDGFAAEDPLWLEGPLGSLLGGRSSSSNNGVTRRTSSSSVL